MHYTEKNYVRVNSTVGGINREIFVVKGNDDTHKKLKKGLLFVILSNLIQHLLNVTHI